MTILQSKILSRSKQKNYDKAPKEVKYKIKWLSLTCLKFMNYLNLSFIYLSFEKDRHIKLWAFIFQIKPMSMRSSEAQLIEMNSHVLHRWSMQHVSKFNLGQIGKNITALGFINIIYFTIN